MRVLLLPLGVTIMGGDPSRRCGFQPMRIGWCLVGHYMAPPSLLPEGDDLLVATDLGPFCLDTVFWAFITLGTLW